MCSSDLDAIIAIVRNWPENFEARRAEALGFVAESDFRQIIRIYIEEDLEKA